jgi:hypothetical protein
MDMDMGTDMDMGMDMAMVKVMVIWKNQMRSSGLLREKINGIEKSLNRNGMH